MKYRLKGDKDGTYVWNICSGWDGAGGEQSVVDNVVSIVVCFDDEVGDCGAVEVLLKTRT